MIKSPIERAKSLIASQQDTTRPDIFELNATLIAQFIIVPIRQEYDKALRSAIEDYLNEHSDPKKEYGPHGESIDWLHPEDVQEAIDKAEVKE